MNDLPARYTALVAKRPELAVTSLFFEPSVMWGSWYRSNTGRPVNLHDADARDDWRSIHADEASALIFRRLCEAMPEGSGVHRALNNPTPRYYAYDDSDSRYSPSPDPISAIFAYWEAQ